MSCRSTPGGAAVSGCATAISGGSADDVPEIMHRLRREYQQSNPGAARPSGQQAALVVENLAMRVRQAPGLTDRRRARVLAKAEAAAVMLREGHKVPDAATLYAWQNLDSEMNARPNARRTSLHPSLIAAQPAPRADDGPTERELNEAWGV